MACSNACLFELHILKIIVARVGDPQDVLVPFFGCYVVNGRLGHQPGAQKITSRMRFPISFKDRYSDSGASPFQDGAGSMRKSTSPSIDWRSRPQRGRASPNNRPHTVPSWNRCTAELVVKSNYTKPRQDHLRGTANRVVEGFHVIPPPGTSSEPQPSPWRRSLV